jgi:hypothetical protein
MEDWLYAAGWDKSAVQSNCAGLNKNEQYVGYFKTGSNSRNLRKLKSTSTASHGNRALVFLVETSNAKAPHKDTLGGYKKVLQVFFLSTSYFISQDIYMCFSCWIPLPRRMVMSRGIFGYR